MEHMDNKLVVTRVVNVSIERVWTAFTDSKELKKWFSPEQMSTPEAKSELRAGGAFMVTMQNDDDKKTFSARGNYQTVEDQRKLELSWKWDGQDSEQTSLMVEFRKVSDRKTEVTLTHSGFTSKESKDSHNKGWESTFNKLEKYLKQSSKVRA